MGTTHEVHNTSLKGGLTIVPGRASALPAHAGVATQKLSPELHLRLRSCAAELLTEFPELNERSLAETFGRGLIRLLSPPGKSSGRPRSHAIDLAWESLINGVPWSQIPWKVLPGFSEMSSSDQSSARERLRRAIYMRHKREAAKNSRLVS
jgi:hypothetical protein